MHNFRKLYGPLLVVGIGLIVAGCQGTASTGGGPVASAPEATSSTTPAKPAASASKPSSRTIASNAAVKKPANTAGLKPYKNYSTTENLCAQTCKSEARCVTQTFKPIQEINGYIAGQCQFFGR